MTAHRTLPPRQRRATAGEHQLVLERHRIDKQRCRREGHSEPGYVDGLYIDFRGVVIAKWWTNGKFDPVQASKLEPIDGSAA